MSRSKTILLIGKSGQLGRHLADRLGGCGEVAAFGSEALDITDRDAVRDKVRSLMPKVIVNAAAYTDVDGAESAPAKAWAVNCEAVRFLAEAAAETDAALLHVSTDYVFDGGKGGAYDETDDPAPINRYGASKRDGERAVAATAARHLIVRTSWLFSEFPGNFVTRIADLLDSRDTLNVVDDQIGSPTDCAFLASAITRILDVADARPDVFGRGPGRIVHVANDGYASRFALADRILTRLRELGEEPHCSAVRPIPTSQYPLPARRPRDSRLAIDLARTHFSLAAPPWQTGLDRVLASIIGSTRSDRSS